MPGNSLADNFAEGDLLYGLQTTREPITLALMGKINSQPNPPFQNSAPVTVDQINQLLFSSEGIRKITLKDVFQQASYPFTIAEHFLQTHRNYLINPHDECCQKLGINNLIAISEGKIPPSISRSRKEISLLNRARRRSVKIGFNHYKVHFLLAGIEAEKVFDEAASLNTPSIPGLNSRPRRRYIYDSFTSAELRYVLSNYERLENSIKFYIQDEAKDYCLAEAYREVDLFIWLAEEEKKIIKARNPQGGFSEGPITCWMRKRLSQGKLALATLQRLQEKLQFHFI